MGGIPAWATKGARVRCVGGGGHPLRGVERPQTGAEYTIRDVAIIDGDAGCWLEEIRNPISIRSHEPGWLLSRFEPVEVIASDPVAHHDALRQAALEGYGKKTAATLAKEYGVSRNVIIGIWYRLRRAGLLPRQSEPVA